MIVAPFFLPNLRGPSHLLDYRCEYVLADTDHHFDVAFVGVDRAIDCVPHCDKKIEKLGQLFRNGYLAHDQAVVAMEKETVDVSIEEVEEGAEKAALQGARLFEPAIISTISDQPLLMIKLFGQLTS